jgi:hypothetical protein
MGAPPVASGLAAAVLPLAAGALVFPLHAESKEAPPAAAANRRNVRRPGDPVAVWLPGSALSFPASAIAARLPFAVVNRDPASVNVRR